MTAAKKIAEPDVRASVLARILPRLKRRFQSLATEEALGCARGIKDPWLRAKTLAYVAGRLPAEERARVYAEALASARSGPRWRHTETLTRIARLLPPALGLDAAREITHAQHKAEALLRLAKRLPAPHRLEIVSEALATAQTVGDPFQQTVLLTRAARHLPPVNRGGVLEAALTAARSFDEPISKAEALLMVARQLPAARQHEVIDQAIKIARSVPSWRELEIIRRVASRLPAEMVHHLAPILGHDTAAAEVHVELLRRAAKSLTPEQALSFARGMDRPGERARLMMEAARRLRGPARRDALAETLAIIHELAKLPNGPRVLLQVARRLPTDTPIHLLTQVADAARTLDAMPVREQILAELARQMPPSESDAVCTEISDVWRRFRVRSARGARTDLVPMRADWIDAVRSVAQHERKRCLQGVAAIVPIIEMIGGPTSVQSLARSIVCVGRWWP